MVVCAFKPKPRAVTSVGFEQTMRDLESLFIRCRSPGNGTFFESANRTAQFLSIIRYSDSVKRCNDCVEFRLSTGKGVRRRTGRNHKLDEKYNVVCTYHNNILLHFHFFKDILDLTEKEPLTSVMTHHAEDNLDVSVKCSGRHPHCSICGMCHTNRLTHDRGHPRYWTESGNIARWL